MKILNPAALVLMVSLLIAVRAAAESSSGEDRAHLAGQSLVGTPAPRIVVKTIDGETIDLKALYGKKAVYLKFWATWCVPCRAQMPHFEHTYDTAGTDLAVIAINVGFNDSLEEIRKYQRVVGITMPIVFDEDGRLGAAFKLRVTPQHIVIGRDGRIRYVGHLADSALDAALAAARQPAGATAAAASLPTEAPPVAVGDALPARSVRTLDGARFAFRQPAPARQTVLVFLSPWCESYLSTTRPAIAASCQRVREEVNALAADAGVRFIGIASGLWASPQDLRKYRSDYQIRIPLSLDESGSLFRAFRVQAVPTVLIADAQGTLIRRVVPDDRDALRDAIVAR